MTILSVAVNNPLFSSINKQSPSNWTHPGFAMTQGTRLVVSSPSTHKQNTLAVYITNISTLTIRRQQPQPGCREHLRTCTSCSATEEMSSLDFILELPTFQLKFILNHSFLREGKCCSSQSIF